MFGGPPPPQKKTPDMHSTYAFNASRALSNCRYYQVGFNHIVENSGVTTKANLALRKVGNNRGKCTAVWDNVFGFLHSHITSLQTKLE